jgi:hypothetical protein
VAQKNVVRGIPEIGLELLDVFEGVGGQVISSDPIIRV